MSRDRVKILILHGLILLAIGQWLIVPLQGMVEDQRQLQREYTEAIMMKRSALKRYQAQSENVAASDRNTGGLLSALYSQPGKPVALQSHILEQLIGKAQEGGLSILNFELPEPVDEKVFVRVPLVLRVKGSPKGVLSLHEYIEKFPKLLLITQFVIQPSGPNFLVTFTLEAIWNEGQSQ